MCNLSRRNTRLRIYTKINIKKNDKYARNLNDAYDVTIKNFVGSYS